MPVKESIKTYRVLRDGMRVGDSVRNFGDLIPEAAEMDTLRSLINANVIETVYVTQEEFDEWKERQAEADAAEDDLDDDLDDEDEVEVAEEPVVAKPKAKVKKTTTKKKISKKGKNSGRRAAEGDGPAVLADESV